MLIKIMCVCVCVCVCVKNLWCGAVFSWSEINKFTSFESSLKFLFLYGVKLCNNIYFTYFHVIKPFM